KSELRSGSLHHSGLRFPAGTAFIRMMRTKVDGIQAGPAFSQQTSEFGMYGLESGRRYQSARQSGLVRDDDHPRAGSFQSQHGFGDPGQELQFFRGFYETRIPIHSAVTVEEDGDPLQVGPFRLNGIRP